MRMMVCRCGAGGGLSVSGEGFGRKFVDGVFVDFDEVAGHVTREADGQQKRVQVTWADAIGEKYAHLFEPATSPAAPAKAAVAEPERPKFKER
jgi:hypothetical protein